MSFELVNGYVLNPQTDYSPSYKISPFSNNFIHHNKGTVGSNDTFKDYIIQRFNRNYLFTSNGKNALRIALKSLKLRSENTVTILTTSGNTYVSKCVTEIIEEFCKWNMEMKPYSSVILVIHEFGFPYDDLFELKKYNLPIIEDCCYTFNSQNAENSAYNVGDYLIFSFPKYFPVQVGGLLLSTIDIDHTYSDDVEVQKFISKSMSLYVHEIDEIAKKRRSNWQYLENLFDSIGLHSRFRICDYITNAVYIFNLPASVNLDKLKVLTNNNGIESSIFYGESAFFIPCHQYLTENDLFYFFKIISNLISKVSK
jgi:hypothetical protein